MDVIARDARHFGALIQLGNLLHRQGYRRAARLTYAQAANAEPHNPIVDVNVGNTYLDDNDLAKARAHFEQALARDPALPEAHQGMSYVFARLGDEKSAARHRDAGFAQRAITEFPFRGEGPPVRVTLLVSALGGNVNTADFLDDRTFAVTRVFAEYAGSDELPESDLVFNAIGDADRCADALRRVASWRASASVVINRPEAVLATSRIEAGALLANIDGLRIPAAVRCERHALASNPGETLEACGLVPPVLLRALGYHTGMFFERAENLQDAAEIALRLPGSDVAVVEYLDARALDGRYRKYRAMIVDGKLYPLHLAISDDWKVHYFTSQTAQRAEHRELERSFLNDMSSAVGARAIAALEGIAAALGLDYAGIDFGLDGSGNVLFFEANAAMIVPSRETNPDLAYRVPYQQAVIQAVRNMLLRRGGKAGLGV